MTDTNVATITSKPPIVILGERLDSRINELRAALPPDVDPEQFKRAVKTAASINPDLQACSWSSLWNACLRAAQDGLLPDGRQGAIVPYKDRATWIPMYQGLIERAYRSGQITWIDTNIIREGDAFDFWTDETGAHFTHRPAMANFEAPMIGAWAAARLKAGGTVIRVMSAAEIEKHRRESKARRDDSPWIKWHDGMSKKTTIKQLAKLLPFELRISDEEDDDDAAVPRVLGAPTPPFEAPRQTGAAAALQAFAGRSEPDAEPEPPQGQDSPPLDLAPPEHASGAISERRAAYERGRQDKERGVARKACPPEYRDNQLGIDWTRGWQGEPWEGE